MPLREFTLTTHTSCGLGGRPELEYPIEIKDQQQLSVEPMHARAGMRELLIEINGRIFTARSSHFQHLADLVDQQSVGFTMQLDPERQLSVAGLFAFQVEPFPLLTTVKMRPRTLRRPAISGGANGTCVRRSGTNTSCTRVIGTPKS